MTIQPHSTVPVFTTGDRLRKARELTGMEQGEFALAIGISRGSVSNYERDIKVPRPIVFNAWALATGVDRDWLETGEGSAYPSPGPGTPARDTPNEVALARLAAKKRRHAGGQGSAGYRDERKLAA